MSKHKLIDERPLANQKIRQARKEKGLTQRQAAEKMGMLYNTYQKMECKGNVRCDWILQFCDALDVPRSFFKEIFDDVPQPDLKNGKRLTFRSPSTVEKQLYGDEPSQEDEQPFISEENNKTIMVELSHTDNAVINTYRGLSKSKQKNAVFGALFVRVFVWSKRFVVINIKRYVADVKVQIDTE